MKKALLFLMLLIMGAGAKAQVGIGTDMPNPSAQLDVTVQAGDKGVLIARVALTGTTDVTTITNGNIESLLVYNTATVADVVPGYYYWYNNKWKRIVTPDDILTTNPNTVNVGLTTDGVDLILNDSDGNFVSLPLSSLSTETITDLVDNGDGTITYTNEEGTVQTVDIASIAQNNESVTTLTDNGDGTYTYTSEDGTMVTFDANTSTLTDNGDGTYTVINADGTTATIDVAGDVLAELQDSTSDIYNEIQGLITAGSDALVDNGDGTFTHSASDGTVVTFDANTSTVTDNGDGTYTLTNADGTTATIDVAGDVLAELQDSTSDIYNEIQGLITAGSDALVDNGDGTFTHTASDGTVVTFDANTSALTDNGDGTYTITNADGTTATIDVAGDVLAELQDNTSDIYNEIQGLITAGSDALVDNGDGTFTHTASDGTVVTFDANTSTVTDNGDGTYTITNADGTTATIDVAGDVLAELQDNTSDIHNEIATLITNEIAANSDALVDNGDGTFTHTASDGTVVTFDSNTSTLTDNGDGTYTITNADGTTATIDVAGDVLAELQDNTSDIYNEVQGLITANETLTTSTFNPTTGIFTYTDEDGTANNLDLGAMLPNFETTTTVVDNGDGTYTFTNEDGTTTTISITGNETVTTLTDNADGTYTYTSEDGTITTVDVPADMLIEIQDNTSTVYQEIIDLIDTQETLTTLVDNADGTFTYTDENGTATTIDGSDMETLTTIALNADNVNIDYTDEAGNITSLDLTAIVTNLETLTSLVDNADGTFTYTDEAGTATTIDGSDMETLTTFVLNADGKTLDYTDEDGIVSSVDLETVIGSFETVTTLGMNAGALEYTNEDGSNADVPLISTDANNGISAGIDGALFVDIAAAETNTTLAFDAATNELTYTNEDSDNPVLDLSPLAIEPWLNQADATKATENTQNIYQIGSVSIGKNAVIPGAMFDVAGAIRGGAPNTTASVGANSIAVGEEVIASGENAAAFGFQSEATGSGAFAGGGYLQENPFGSDTPYKGGIASGRNSFAFGRQAEATAAHAITMGFQSKATSMGAVAIGYNAEAHGESATAFGRQTRANSRNETVIGSRNAIEISSATAFVPTDPILQVGVGNAINFNALTILKNGKMGIGIAGQNDTAKPTEMLDIGSGNVKVRDLPTSTGSATDNVVVVDATGVLKSVAPADLETITTLTDNLDGTYTYTSEDGTANTFKVTQSGSGDPVTNTITGAAGDIYVDGSTGELYTYNGTSGTWEQANPAAVNLYNSDGALTGNRTLDLNGSYLRFDGTDQRTSWGADGSITQTNLLPTSGSASMSFLGGNNTNLYIQAFSGGSTQIIASGGATNFIVGTGYTTGPTYLRFDTSPGGGLAPNPAMYINSDGNLGIGTNGLAASEKLDVTEGNARIRDINTYTGAATDNVVVADADGVLKTVAVDNLAIEPWLNQADGTKASDNTQNIYQMGNVGIGTTDMLGTTNTNVKLAVNGAILTTNSIYADYVFEDYFEGRSELNNGYAFKSLKEVEKFIQKNRHLPGITKIDALAKNEKGDYIINTTQLSVQLLEKVEELYLHTIEQQRILEDKNEEIKTLKESQDKLEQRMERLEKLLLKKGNNK